MSSMVLDASHGRSAVLGNDEVVLMLSDTCEGVVA